MSEKSKIIAIVGPTASGKTSLSIKLAKRFNAEVISADSRQVYKGLNIGTGKVTSEEMSGIPHHLLDVADPHEVYTVTDFVRDGRNAISEIISHNRLPIVVGGTFLYVDALLGKVSVPEVPPNESLRADLEKKSNENLFELLKSKDPVRAETIDSSNPRRLVRALEIVEALGAVPEIKIESPYETLTLGITISKEQLQKNIHARLMSRLETGMIDEVIALHKNGLSYERMSELGIEYAYIAEFLQNKITHEEMCSLIETKSIQYAKRQMTWLKRDTSIVWVEPSEIDRIEAMMEEFLR